MKQNQELANRLREVVLNGTWIANTNFKDQLKTVDWKTATQKVDSVNTISELSQHIHYYIQGIKNFFINGKLEIHDKDSFNFPPITSQNQWESFLKQFWKDTEELAQFLEKLTDEQLNATFVNKQYGTYLRNINAMIEHSYYHLGQIVIVKKLISSN